MTATRTPRAKPRPGIDPRMRERRVQVTRQRGLRRLRLVLTTLFALALGIGAVSVTRSPLLDVDRVVVVGAQQTPVAAIVSAAHLRRGRPMLSIDPGLARRRIGALPWVGVVRVERQWPGTIKVTVAERTPVAVMPAPGGKWAAVDAEGRVLTVGPSGPSGLLVVDGAPPPGPPGSTARAGGALAVAAALPRQVIPRVPIVALVGTGELELRMTPAGVVRLGTPDNVSAKVDALLTLLESADLTGVTAIDVRVPGVPVLTRGGPSGTVSTNPRG